MKVFKVITARKLYVISSLLISAFMLQNGLRNFVDNYSYQPAITFGIVLTLKGLILMSLSLFSLKFPKIFLLLSFGLYVTFFSDIVSELISQLISGNYLKVYPQKGFGLFLTIVGAFFNFLLVLYGVVSISQEMNSEKI
jgi:hypothetical protein